MELPTDFNTFLSNIRPSPAQRDNLKDAHIRLRERLMQDAQLRDTIIATFLQGSYRRNTAVRPRGDDRPDVDIIVVTNLGTTVSPAVAMGEFKPFLRKHYSDKWRSQGRSFGIEMSKVDLDVVITSAPPESERQSLMAWALAFLSGDESGPNWKQSPLWIPDRRGGTWDQTDPLEQISWTHKKNAATNGHFVNVVKALKWWRLENPNGSKHPKGFPLERLIGEQCPDCISSVSDGVLRTLEAIRDRTSPWPKPWLADYGVPSHDVLAQLSDSDWRAFHEQATASAGIARAAIKSRDADESRALWRQLFGTQFPGPAGGGGGRRDGNFVPPSGPGDPDAGRFA